MILFRLSNIEVSKSIFGECKKWKFDLFTNLRNKGSLEDLDEEYCIGYLPHQKENNDVGILILKYVLNYIN